jgi:hypothetical protein
MKKLLVAKIFIYFLLMLFPSLILWSNIKYHYNYFLSSSVFYFVAKYYDLEIRSVDIKDKEILFEIKNKIPFKDLGGVKRDFEMKLSLYIEAMTFNLPMTFSILIAICLALSTNLKRKFKVFFIGIILLFFLHLITMGFFVFCIIKEVAKDSNAYVVYYLSQHLIANDMVCVIKDFLINYAIRFEPFLIAFFAWIELRNKKSAI